jgi:hypothetical protein
VLVLDPVDDLVDQLTCSSWASHMPCSYRAGRAASCPSSGLHPVHQLIMQQVPSQVAHLSSVHSMWGHSWPL